MLSISFKPVAQRRRRRWCRPLYVTNIRPEDFGQIFREAAAAMLSLSLSRAAHFSSTSVNKINLRLKRHRRTSFSSSCGVSVCVCTRGRGRPPTATSNLCFLHALFLPPLSHSLSLSLSLSARGRYFIESDDRQAARASDFLLAAPRPPPFITPARRGARQQEREREKRARNGEVGGNDATSKCILRGAILRAFVF